MPLMRCQSQRKSGVRWGRSGHCYTGRDARRKALRQAAAIKAAQARREEALGYVPFRAMYAQPQLQITSYRDLDRGLVPWKATVGRTMLKEELTLFDTAFDVAEVVDFGQWPGGLLEWDLSDCRSRSPLLADESASLQRFCQSQGYSASW